MARNPDIVKLETVLHGGNGGGGLVGRVGEMNERIRKLEIGHAKLVAVASVLGGLVSGGVVALLKLLGG